MIKKLASNYHFLLTRIIIRQSLGVFGITFGTANLSSVDIRRYRPARMQANTKQRAV